MTDFEDAVLLADGVFIDLASDKRAVPFIQFRLNHGYLFIHLNSFPRPKLLFGPRRW